MKSCHKCGTVWDGITQPGTKETCNKCFTDLHVCMNCRFYDVHKPNQCQIETDPIIDKEKANFCEEFQFVDRDTKEKPKDEKQKAREKLNRLFKK